MELELKKTCLDAYETSVELTLTQEETAETIVPDYCPDIARNIETTGRVFLHSRELRDGRGTVSGTVRVTVLYTPEASEPWNLPCRSPRRATAAALPIVPSCWQRQRRSFWRPGC